MKFFLKSKKKKKDSKLEYEEVVSKINIKDNKMNKAVDNVEFFLIESEDLIFDLADKVKKNIPLVINFDSLDIEVANKVITFLSGCLYLLDGSVIEIKDKIYLFCSSSNLSDGSLDNFVNEYR